MKHTTLRLLLVTIAAACITQQANAKIWRVNNNATGTYGDNMGGTVTFPVFKQLAEVNSSNLVMQGDTIHLEGSAMVYDNATLTKRLIIIGPGYFLNENPNVSTNVLSSTSSYITFNNGSQGSQLIGVYVQNSFGITINVSNILIKRCRIDYSIGFTYDLSDIRILQNYFANVAQNASSAVVGNNFGFPTDVVFNNNICRKTLILRNNSTIYTLLECKNNVFESPAITNNPSIELNAGSFQNNILVTPNAIVNINNGTNQNVSFNISASASNQFGTANNNIVVTNMTTLFVDPATNTTDGDYQLRPGSPGNNTGSDGTDRGAFGGLAPTNRYTLSGLPPIPVIYEITTLGVAGPAGLPVTIKVRTVK